MTDDDSAEIGALADEFPGSTHYLCSFHVLKAWRKKILTKRNGDNQLEKDALKELRDILYMDCTIGESINKKLAQMKIDFLTKWQDVKPEITTYIENFYFNRLNQWVIALRQRPHLQIDTNNILEAFHKKLKHYWLDGKRNRRVDTLIYYLHDEVEPDLKRDSIGAIANVGRMNPHHRDNREREIRGDDYMMDNLHKISDTCFSVHSDTSEIQYIVQSTCKNPCDLSNFECTCKDFLDRQLPCKHIFAIFNNYFRVRETSPALYLEEYDQGTQMELCLEDVLIATKVMVERAASMGSNHLRSFFEGINREMTLLEKKILEENIVEANNILPPTITFPSNSNFERQRRV